MNIQSMIFQIFYITLVILFACWPFLFIIGVMSIHSTKLKEQVFFSILVGIIMEFAATLWYFWVKKFIQTHPQLKEYGNLPITGFIIISVIIAIVITLIISLYIHDCRSEKRKHKRK